VRTSARRHRKRYLLFCPKPVSRWKKIVSGITEIADPETKGPELAQPKDARREKNVSLNSFLSNGNTFSSMTQAHIGTTITAMQNTINNDRCLRDDP
jgi:hypothetical protein